MEKKKTDKIYGSLVKKPIQRSLLFSLIGFMLILSLVLAIFSYRIFSRTLYSDYDSRLNGVVTYIEHNVDADDLDNCLRTGTTSEKYERAQQVVNILIDDMSMDYIYIVIPKPEEGIMLNAMSATSAAEREAGEEDLPILFETDAYSKTELERYKSFWDADEIHYFEETSEYGRYYTACKPLKKSSGETVALICVDLSSKTLHERLNTLLIYSILSAIFMIGLFGTVTIIWLRKKVTNPLLALENSTRNFASKDRDKKDARDFHFDMPVIKTENEVRSLGEAIKKMAEDMRSYVEERLSMEGRIHEKEEENQRLMEQAEAAEKIATLKASFSTLFTNMPAIAFSKDVENGEYIACNKAFADYVGKQSPDEVVGLKDGDIFEKKTASRIADDDKKVLLMDAPYVFFEEVSDKKGNKLQMQTKKLKFIDESGRLCILGMSMDITEINKFKKESLMAKAAYEEARDESVTYSNIARALAVDYAYIYYVDLRSDRFIEYSQDRLGDELLVERRGDDFFAESRRDAEKLLHVDDRAAFIQAFTKENILSAIEKRGKFTLTYRLLVDDVPVYMNMKATKMENDDHHLIIGVNNVDAQMKYQEAFERVVEERLTYARITALSGDYICVYTVDPNTEKYIEYSATKDYEELGLAKEGEGFFRRAVEESERTIYHADRNKFLSTFTKENVLKAIKDNKLFAINYRLLIDQIPTYVCLKAAVIEEKDGPQLIIGISNIDAQVKREEEFARTLSVERTKANVDALTGVRNKHAYVDFEAKLNRQIEEKEDVRFAIGVFDINGLKTVNDTFGHHKGDMLIMQASKVICTIFEHSPVFRIGGDEFAVIIQGEDYDNIEKLMAKVEKNNKKNMGKGDVVVACGIAKYDKDKKVSAVFDRADIKMYENKKLLKQE